MRYVSRSMARAVVLVFIAIPIIYFGDFHSHFYAYLTGSVITDVIRGQWHIVAISIAFSLAFFILLSYRRKVKWSEYGIVSAFFVSLFVEMYGMPLTILFASKYFFKSNIILPRNIFEFYFLGVGFGMDVSMAYGTILIVSGTFLILAGWITLHGSLKESGFASKGIYSVSRHPQYLGFIMITIGWLFGWPTVLTIIFVPFLVYKYLKLCQEEEAEMIKRFPQYAEYEKTVPFLV